MMKKTVAALLGLCLCLSLCACGRKETQTVVEPVETPEATQRAEKPAEPTAALPESTSEELKLYAYALSNGHKYVVNDFGQYTDQFTFDKDGNIVDLDGSMVIQASNVMNYRPIRTMYFSQDRYNLTAEGNSLNTGNELSSTQIYSNCVVELYCAPASATNGVICVRSASEAVIEIRPNGNARFVSVDSKDLENGEVALRADDLSRPIQIYVRVLTNLAKEARIIARSLDRTAEAECIVTVELTENSRAQAAGTNLRGGTVAVTPTPTPTPAIAPIQGATEFVNASGNPANHIHTYSKTVTAPTKSNMGYTTYTCTGCGYFYQDDFISKLMPEEPAVPSHIHSYTASAVPPTETEQGYTLYVCEVCGDSYKANYTPALGR